MWPDAYSLPAATLARAQALSRGSCVLEVAEAICSLVAIFAAVHAGWFATLRGWLAARTSRRWLQGVGVIAAYVTFVALVLLPFEAWGHHLSRAYGLSVQAWPSWSADFGLSWLLGLGLAVPLGLVLFAVLRRSPRFAWLWFWLVAVVVQLALVFVSPYAIEPLFDHFEPLAWTQPALVESLGRIVVKSGEVIPPERMFLMRASDKRTTPNAYVTGFGSSERIVVWDTTFKDVPLDEIELIFGHELGHYALGHIVRMLVWFAGALLVGFFLAHRLTLGLIARYGAAWRVSSIDDWAATAVIALVVTVASLVAPPFVNALSRRQEHDADVYGQEILHGIVPEPRATAARSFQRLGELYLEVPDPNPLWVFWTYTHPSISERLRFAAHYDPWQGDGGPRFFR